MTAPPPKKTKVNCAAKRRYQDELAARAAAMAHLESGKSMEKALWVYRCPECDGGWHLTKQPQPGTYAVTAKNPFA